jgi:CBS domain-containing protein
MQEAVEEEFAIMEEQSREGAALDFETLLQPVSTLCGGSPPVLGIGASARDAVQVLATRPENCVLVVDSGALVGLVTSRDVTKRLAAGTLDDFDASIETVMTPNPETLRLEDSILSLLGKLYAAGFSCVPVVDEHGFPLHVLTIRDTFEGLLQHFDREIRTTPPMPYYGEPYVWGG